MAGLILVRPFAETSVWWDQSLLRPELLVFEDDILKLFRLTDAEAVDLESMHVGARDEGSIEI